MSGKPNRTPMDIAKNRKEYLANLQMEIANIDKNFQANQTYLRTGAPTQITDTRSTAEKLADLYRLRIDIRSKLGEIMDGSTAQNVVQGLSDSEARFLAQQLDTIIPDLKKKYRLGVPEDAFNIYFQKYIRDFQKSLGLTKEEEPVIKQTLPDVNELQVARRIIADLDFDTEFRGWLEIEYPEYDRTQDPLIGSVVIRQLMALEDIVRNIPRQFELINRIENPLLRMELINELNFFVGALPSKTQIGTLMARIDQANRLKDRISAREGLLRLMDATALGDDVEAGIEEYNNTIEENDLQNEIPELPRLTLGEMPSDEVIEQMSMKEEPITEPPKKRIVGKKTEIPNKEYYSRPLGDATIDRTPIRDDSGGISLKNYLRTINSMVDDRDFKGIFIDTPLRNSAYTSVINDYSASTIREVLKNEEVKKRIEAIYRQNAEQQQREEMRQQLLGPSFGLTQGRGLSKRMKGKGIAVNKIDYTAGIISEPDYVPFGKFLLNRKRLNNGVMMIKRHNGQFIPDLKTKRISQNLTNVFKKVAGGSIPSFSDLEKLDDEEREYLNFISKRSNLSSKLEVPSPKKDSEEQLINKFEIMRGQLIAGNDSKDLVKKFKQIIITMIEKDLLPKGQARDILLELTRMEV